MDLAQLEPTTDAVVIPVRNPNTNVPLRTEKGEPITVSILSIDSDAFKARQRAVANRRLAGGRRSKVTAEEMEEEALSTIVACISGWSNITFEGKAVEFSPANVRMLLTRLPWLREQIDEDMANRANFMKSSPTNS